MFSEHINMLNLLEFYKFGQEGNIYMYTHTHIIYIHMHTHTYTYIHFLHFIYLCNYGIFISHKYTYL